MKIKYLFKKKGAKMDYTIKIRFGFKNNLLNILSYQIYQYIKFNKISFVDLFLWQDY